MKVRPFQSSYAKLFLVTEEIYDRLISCIDEKSEKDEIKSLNTTETDLVDNNVLKAEDNDSPILEQIFDKVQDIDSKMSENNEVLDKSLEQSSENTINENDLAVSKDTFTNDTLSEPQKLTTDMTTKTTENPKRDIAIQTDDRVINEPWKKFSCYVCSLRFSTKSVLNQHLDYVHSIRNKKFQCHQCSIFFSTNYTRNRHLLNIHSKDNNESRSENNLSNIQSRKCKLMTPLEVVPSKLSKNQATKRKISMLESQIPKKKTRFAQGIKRKFQENTNESSKRTRFDDWQ